jgi:hypothetical protein
MFSEAFPTITEEPAGVTGAVGERVDVGEEIEVLIKGPDVTIPVVVRLVTTDPTVLGVCVIVGRI